MNKLVTVDENIEEVFSDIKIVMLPGSRFALIFNNPEKSLINYKSIKSNDISNKALSCPYNLSEIEKIAKLWIMIHNIFNINESSSITANYMWIHNNTNESQVIILVNNNPDLIVNT